MTTFAEDVPLMRHRYESFHLTGSFMQRSARKNIAVLIRLFAMTPSPTQRAVPSAPQ